jgi:hypothetical protein
MINVCTDMGTPYYHITYKVRQVGIYDYLRIVGEYYQNLLPVSNRLDLTYSVRIVRTCGGFRV